MKYDSLFDAITFDTLSLNFVILIIFVYLTLDEFYDAWNDQQ